MQEVTWTFIKAQSDTRRIPLQYTETSNVYEIYLFDGSFHLHCTLDKNSTDTTDLDDFETNYKSIANVTTTDQDGSIIVRSKAAKKGWTYHLSGIEFETSVLSSIVHNNVDGNALSCATIKLYDNTDTEITTQASANLNCVKTVIEFEPTYDYEIIGGTIKTVSNTIGDYRIWVVAVPDLTPAQGGSKVMVENLNLKFVDPNNGVQADGRASKLMTYNATYHTNKLQLTVKHPAGGKEKMLLALELFRQ